MQQHDYRENNFDLIRLLAAFQVMLVHGYEHFGLTGAQWFIDALGLFPGVPVFFITSGFLITGAYQRNPQLRGYFRNRGLRIYPALWVCFAVSLLLLWWVFKPAFELRSLLVWSAAQLSIGQFYNAEFFRPFGVGVLNGSLWTIPVELQFYLLLPFLLMLLDRLRWHWAIIAGLLLVLAVINRLLFHVMSSDPGIAGKLFSVTIFPYLFAFLCGVLCQRYAPTVIGALRGRALACLAVFLLVSGLCHLLGVRNHGNHIHPILIVMMACVVIAFAYTAVDKFGHLLHGMDISYGVYIYHMIVINVLLHLGQFSAWSNFALTIVVTTLLGLASWVLVERPALARKKFTVRALPSIAR